MIKLNAAPVLLIYHLSTDEKTGKSKVDGVPVPIYLSEELTGLCVDSESDSLTISSDYIPVLDSQKKDEAGMPIKVQQRGETQQAKIALKANKNAIGLNILLPLLKSILSLIFAKKEYRIAYLNQNVLIFNARLNSYSMDPGSNDTLVKIEITLDVLPEKAKDADGSAPVQVSAANLEDIL